jgi:hypothetical protein
MKVTLEFDIDTHRSNMLDAIHASPAWAALEQIKFLLRQREKHGVSDAITLQRIEEEVQDVYDVRGNQL